jgi:hypothetical protein
VPVTVARAEVHPAIDIGGVLAQDPLGHAQRLDELAPVHEAEEAQAADGVADRDLHRRLHLRLVLHQLLDGKPASERRCSIQVSGSASAEPCPCSFLASSATNGLTIGGLERAMSAITRMRLWGSRAATSIICSAHASARRGRSKPRRCRDPTRRRFSIRARRSMMGMAHSSPIRNAVTDW